MKSSWIIKAHQGTLDNNLRDRWKKLLLSSEGNNLNFQNCDYFDYLASRRHLDNAFIAYRESNNCELQDLAVLIKDKTSISFKYFNFSISGYKILGTLPVELSPESFETLIEFLCTHINDFDAIEIRELPSSSAIFSQVNKSDWLRSNFICYAPKGMQQVCHTVDIPDSFETYLRSYSKKSRYNLRRQERLLNEWGNGQLKLFRVQTSLDVGILHNAILALQVPDINYEDLLDLADKNLLLSYTLHLGDHPCALAFGTIYDNILFLHVVRHDSSLNRFSPGTTLQLLLIKDLIELKVVTQIDYGFGNTKTSLNSNEQLRTTVLFLRKTLLNNVMIKIHNLLRKFFIE